MNKVISREYVEKNYIHKEYLKGYLEAKIDELSKIHNTSEEKIEREISKGMAVLLKMVEIEILEETEDVNK